MTNPFKSLLGYVYKHGDLFFVGYLQMRKFSYLENQEEVIEQCKIELIRRIKREVEIRNSKK